MITGRQSWGLGAVVALILMQMGGTVCAQTDSPVFEGAEGFGVFTPAGSGGDTVRVTNLDDAGPGSLRAAIDRPGRRVIVFDVAGIIKLESRLTVRYGFVSILGQTAPSPGITLRDHSLQIQTGDVLVQHLRIRVGDKGAHTSDMPDGIKIDGTASGLLDVSNIVIDHCSVSWTIDEAIEIWADGVHDVTVSNCIFAEALNRSLHPHGPHGYGPFIDDRPRRIALINNLIAHFAGRNPEVHASESVIVNNVIYDPMLAFIAITSPRVPDKSIAASIIGNVCLRGPSRRGKLERAVWAYKVGPETVLYIRDNECPECSDDPRTQLDLSSPSAGVPASTVRLVDEPPVMCEPLTIRPRAEVLEYVLANAGARPWDRDRHDKRVIENVRTRGGKIIDSQEDVGGW